MTSTVTSSVTNTVTSTITRQPGAASAPETAARPTTSLPPLRRLPLPRTDPPYDDEPGGPPHPTAVQTQGTLALAFVLPSGLPVAPTQPRLRLVRDDDRPPRRIVESGYLEDPDLAPRLTPRSALPEPRSWAGRFVQALVEVLGGARPYGQLARWTSADVYAEVQSLVTTGAWNERGRTADTVRPRVRSLHLSEPADGVAECCALVQRGPRATAVALRLEGVDGRWKCTVLALP